MEYCSTELAAELAEMWCGTHPGWQRICDIGDTTGLYKTWGELSQKTRAYWERHFPSDPEYAWREFGDRPCKVPFGHITGKGVFVKSILDVPRFHNSMMVFKTGLTMAKTAPL